MLTAWFFPDFDALRRDMDRLVESFDKRATARPRPSWGAALALETGWTDDYLNLRLVLPGVPEDSLDVTVQGNQLVVRGERPAPENFGKLGSIYQHLPYGKFERTVDLPNGLKTERIEAQLHHGLLDIRVPVSESVKPRRIENQNQTKGAKTIAA